MLHEQYNRSAGSIYICFAHYYRRQHATRHCKNYRMEETTQRHAKREARSPLCCIICWVCVFVECNGVSASLSKGKVFIHSHFIGLVLERRCRVHAKNWFMKRFMINASAGMVFMEMWWRRAKHYGGWVLPAMILQDSRSSWNISKMFLWFIPLYLMEGLLWLNDRNIINLNTLWVSYGCS